MLWTEVHELFTSINEAIIPHFFESSINAVDDVFIKSKGEVIPSTGSTESTNLKLHIATLFGNEVPDARIEFIAVKFKTSMAFFFEGALVHDPGFKAGMIGTRDVPRAKAF